MAEPDAYGIDMICASEDMLGKICTFFGRVIDETPGLTENVRWKKDVYPAEADFLRFIREGAMYLFTRGDSIVGAMAVTMYQTEAYHGIDWREKLDDSDVAVIHTLCVSPDFQHCGLAKPMLDRAVDIAKKGGKRSIRLDAISTNLHAIRIYEKYGFEFRGSMEEFYLSTGVADFRYYEMSL